MKDHHKISLLLGAGAVAVLIYLLMQKKAAVASNGSQIPNDAVAQPEVYPQNPVPQGTSDGGAINIGGSPITMTYNYGEPLPTLALGGNTAGECGCDTYCDTAGQKVTVQTVPPEVLASANSNYESFAAKVPQPRVTFVESGAALVQPSSVGQATGGSQLG